MTAKDLFAVFVRSVGLVLLVIGILQVASDVAAFLSVHPPPPHGSDLLAIDGPEISPRWITQSLILNGLGLVFLFATKWVVRLVYGSQP